MATAYSDSNVVDSNGNSNEQRKSVKRSALIGFIVFFILAILLLIFALYWFVWRDAPTFKRSCSTDNQCGPNEVCADSLCRTVECTVDSECSRTANGQGFCVNGFCQTATCQNNSDCRNLGDSFVCSKGLTIENSSTPWISSACVRTGDSCSSNTDCFGDNYTLFCIEGVCRQCGADTDCDTGLCSDGVCISCTSDGMGGQGECANGKVCGNGICCNENSTKYNVNGDPFACAKGIMYDLCKEDSDCASDRCISLGRSNADDKTTEVKVCGGSNGDMLFSAGASVSVGDPDTISSLTCSTPAGLNDVETTPFNVNGACIFNSNLGGSVNTADNGSACGRPSYCDNPSHSGNLLCNGQVKFSNPFQQFCSQDEDCNDGLVCDPIARVCAQPCEVTTDCSTGLICAEGSNDSKVCRYPVNEIVCAQDSNPDNNDGCPVGYGCNTSTGFCSWISGDGDDNPPPPPVVLSTVCSRPATAIPSGRLDSYAPGYCVAGFCSSNAGWINNHCTRTEDCMVTDFEFSDGPRTSLVCRQDDNDVSICVGGNIN